MDREAARREIREKAGELEDFLEADISIGPKKNKKAVDVIDPFWTNTEIKNVVNAIQFLMAWCTHQIIAENAPYSDEVFEEEKITTLDDEYRDRGLHRGMFG